MDSQELVELANSSFEESDFRKDLEDLPNPEQLAKMKELMNSVLALMEDNDYWREQLESQLQEDFYEMIEENGPVSICGYKYDPVEIVEQLTPRICDDLREDHFKRNVDGVKKNDENYIKLAELLNSIEECINKIS